MKRGFGDEMNAQATRSLLMAQATYQQIKSFEATRLSQLIAALVGVGFVLYRLNDGSHGSLQDHARDWASQVVEPVTQPVDEAPIHHRRNRVLTLQRHASQQPWQGERRPVALVLDTHHCGAHGGLHDAQHPRGGRCRLNGVARVVVLPDAKGADRLVARRHVRLAQRNGS